MSWDDYITNLIARMNDNLNVMAQTEDGNADTWCKACIIGLDGSIWTTGKHANALKILINEATTIARCFKCKDFTPFITNGVYIEGYHHIYLRELDGKFVWARGNECIFLQASKTAIVITSWPTHIGAQGYQLEKSVDAIVKYLESQNM